MQKLNILGMELESPSVAVRHPGLSGNSPDSAGAHNNQSCECRRDNRADDRFDFGGIAQDGRCFTPANIQSRICAAGGHSSRREAAGEERADADVDFR